MVMTTRPAPVLSEQDTKDFFRKMRPLFASPVKCEYCRETHYEEKCPYCGAPKPIPLPKAPKEMLTEDEEPREENLHLSQHKKMHQDYLEKDRPWSRVFRVALNVAIVAILVSASYWTHYLGVILLKG